MAPTDTTQRKLFHGHPQEGKPFEATRFSDVCAMTATEPAAGTSSIVSSAIDLP